MPHRRPAGLLAILAFASLLGQAAWMDATVGTYDEGLVLVGADRVLKGDMPYRDFWTLYGPAAFYVPAALFRWFGETVLVERAYDIAVKTALVLLSFRLMLLYGRRGVAMVGALLVTGLLIYLRNYGAPLFPAMAAILAAALMLHRVAASGSRPAAIGAGVLIGIATLFRHDLGVCALLCAGVWLVRAARWARFDGTWPSARGALPGACIAAFACTVAPWVIALIPQVPLADLYRDFVRIPLFVYPAVRALPFPAPGDLLGEAFRRRSAAPLGEAVVYLPLLVVVGCLIGRLRHGSAATAPAGMCRHPSRQLFDLLIAFGVFFIAKGIVRVSPFQMGAALIVSVVLAVAAAALAVQPIWRNGLLAAGALACVALLAKPLVTAAARSSTAPGSGAASALLSDRWAGHLGTLCRETAWPRLRCFRLDPFRQAVAQYLHGDGGAGRLIYFGLGRHDKIFVADLALPFVVEAVEPTRWHDLHPGVQTTLEVQADMIRELEARPPERVVIDTAWDDEKEPNASARSSGVGVLDAYLRSRYRPVFTAGPLTVMVPVASPLP